MGGYCRRAHVEPVGPRLNVKSPSQPDAQEGQRASMNGTELDQCSR